MKSKIKLFSFISLGLLCLAWLFPGCAKKPGHVTPLPGGKVGWFETDLSEGLSIPSVEEPLVKSPAPRKMPLRSAALGLRGVGAGITMAGNATELWILTRGEPRPSPAAPDQPGSGTLMATIDQKQVPMPLRHTDVRASIRGYIGTVDVTQQFQNPYSEKIEAIYVFPLPHNAAINDFIMTIGERRIRGIIRDRQEAEQIYQQAKHQGYVASLLTEERPNVFSQSVANIEPGRAVDVQIRYFHTLEYADGWYEFVFPMVVGPRFNPAGTTDGIGAVAHGHTGASNQKTEVHYLPPGERTGHDISLQVEVDPGTTIEQFECKSHRVNTETPAPERLIVSLDSEDTLPNKDFVLRYRVAGDRIKSSFITHQDERGGFFSLMLFPPQEFDRLERQPLELVFVLDCSGSMSGASLHHAKAAIERGLNLLQRGDSFQIVTFSMQASRLGPHPLEATTANLRQGLHYLAGLRGGGGTMMIEGIKAALDFPHDPRRLRFVCFLTDGYIGNEAEILREVHQRIGASRIFSFGIGSSVNRYLLDHMARAGRGAVAYLGPRDDSEKIMGDFFARISHPALTDVTIDWGGLKVTEVYPRTIPDLFVGRPVILTGRFEEGQTGAVRLTGNAAGHPVQIPVPTEGGAAAQANGLPSVWARAKIADLSSEALYEPNAELPGQIKQLALDFNLMSPFTAFVAVDSFRQTEGTEGTPVPVAVPVPEGVEYETTITGNQ